MAHALEPDELAVEVKILTRRPGELDDVEPLLGVGVARLVVAQRGAEHLEFALVPAADEVEAEAPLTDMVGGDELFRGDQRRDQRRVHGPEHRQPLGLGEQATGPGHRLQGRALIVRLAAITFPTADRQQNSMPARLATCASRTQSGQLPDHRSGTIVTARPEEQLAPNRPSLSRLVLPIAARTRLLWVSCLLLLIASGERRWLRYINSGEGMPRSFVRTPRC